MPTSLSSSLDSLWYLEFDVNVDADLELGDSNDVGDAMLLRLGGRQVPVRVLSAVYDVEEIIRGLATMLGKHCVNEFIQAFRFLGVSLDFLDLAEGSA